MEVAQHSIRSMHRVFTKHAVFHEASPALFLGPRGAGSSGCLPDGVPGVKEKGRKSPGYMLMVLRDPTCH